MARFSPRPPTPNTAEHAPSGMLPERTAHAPMVARSPLRAWIIWAFWMLIIGALYLVMNQLLAPPKAVYSASGQGELQLPRHRDGHFYVDGAVNGVPVQFMVDTGASLVSVSNAVAQAANLQGGRTANFSTAGGTRQGRIVRADTLSLAGFELQGVEVGTGLTIGDADQALLGQNVLRHFNIQIERDRMVLRPR